MGSSWLGQRVLRRTFAVEVIWTQPGDQEYDDDWGSVIGNAIAQESSATIWAYDEGTLEELAPAAASNQKGPR